MSKAVVANGFGGPDVLEVIDRPLPTPGAGQVRVRVEAAALNPVDVGVRVGAFGLTNLTEPYILGWDLAGVVNATGEGVTDWAIGQQVIGFVQWLQEFSGTHAEHVVVASDALVAAPKSLSSAEAATLPLNTLTAVQALNLSGLTKGQTVVITGAAGALGGYLTEAAAQRGLRVIAVARATDKDWLRARGAADVIERTDDLPAAVRALVPDGADGLLDPAAIGQAAIGAVRDGGVFVGAIPPLPVSERRIHVDRVEVVPNQGQLAEIAAAADRGEFTPRVAELYPLDQAAAAHARQQRGNLRGRIVLVP